MNHQQKKVIEELSEMMAAEGLRMMVFKGQANAALYPCPEHRAVGDKTAGCLVMQNWS